MWPVNCVHDYFMGCAEFEKDLKLISDPGLSKLVKKAKRMLGYTVNVLCRRGRDTYCPGYSFHLGTITSLDQWDE